MAVILRGPTGPDSVQRLIIEGTEYQLRWRWLARAARWALDLSDAEGNLLAGGIAVVPAWPLLAAVRAGRPAPQFPAGEIFILDPRERPEPPTLEGLGRSPSQIVYAAAGEVA